MCTKSLRIARRRHRLCATVLRSPRSHAHRRRGAPSLPLPLANPPAQWPDRPVKMIVPLGAGGPADLVGRYIAQQLGEKFKQSFFIENRPGAAGIIGTAEAAKAAPDGYTILVVASPHINLEILSHNKSYDLMRDFAPVAVSFSTDAVMVVQPTRCRPRPSRNSSPSPSRSPAS